MEKNECKPVKRIVRLPLRSTSEKILADWTAQIRELYPTYDPSHTDLMNWAVDRTPILSKKDIAEIKRRYFDDVKELEVLLLELRKAKASGDKQLVSQLLGSISFRRKASSTSDEEKKENFDESAHDNK